MAVECGTPSSTCFCTSMGTGPGAGAGYDLALTELAGPVDGDRTYYVRVGSVAGAEVLAQVPHGAADDTVRSGRRAVVDGASERMGRSLDTEDLPGLLARNLEHPRWGEVAERCLSCGNCTLVCPTCFCSDVKDVTDVSGTVERQRRWASCFDLEPLLPPRWLGATHDLFALSAVDDPQALDVVGSVRRVGLRGVWPVHRVVPGRHRHHRGGCCHSGNRWRVHRRHDQPDGERIVIGAGWTTDELLREHRFLAGVSRGTLALLSESARIVSFDPGALLLREGEDAGTLFLVTRGRVAIEIHAPSVGPIVIDTVEPGHVVGLSWMAAPFRWQFDARALEPVEAVAIDARTSEGGSGGAPGGGCRAPPAALRCAAGAVAGHSDPSP